MIHTLYYRERQFPLYPPYRSLHLSVLTANAKNKILHMVSRTPSLKADTFVCVNATPPLSLSFIVPAVLQLGWRGGVLLRVLKAPRNVYVLTSFCAASQSSGPGTKKAPAPSSDKFPWTSTVLQFFYSSYGILLLICVCA